MLKENDRYGKWIVMKFHRRHNHMDYFWCFCDCGTKRSVKAYNIEKGFSSSCGCDKTLNALKANTNHGQAKRGSHSPEYRAWIAMKTRCFKPSSEEYRWYGARGVTVCKRWANSFENFLADMGPRPTPKHSIDRIDNNGNYTPKNCRWVTSREQMRNTSRNVNLAYRGKTQCVASWAEELGLNVQTVRTRLNRGWSTADALRTTKNIHRAGDK